MRVFLLLPSPRLTRKPVERSKNKKKTLTPPSPASGRGSKKTLSMSRPRRLALRSGPC
jgi:hypothetical protein